MIISKKKQGFSLIELLIAIVIIGILASIALPSYQNSVRKTYRQTAKSVLLGMILRQDQFMANNKSYSATLTDLGYTSDTYYIDEDGNYTAVAADSTYLIAINNATVVSYDFTATPQGNQIKDTLCATFTAFSDGRRTVSGTLEANDCW